MAQYQHLPIYKTTYELLSAVVRLTANFPKAHKHSLGEQIRKEVVEMVVFVFKANSARVNRATHVLALLERLQVVQLLLRLAKDLHIVSIKQFAETVSLSDSLGRQAQGWIKSSAPLAASGLSR